MQGIEIQDRIMILLRNGSKTFHEILDGMLGIYPIDLQDELGLLLQKGSISQRLGRFYLSEKMPLITDDIEKAKTGLEDIISALHNPHSLDYEWWFTPETTEKVFYRITDSIRIESAKMCFLGAPLIGAFCHCLRVGNEICIVDKSVPSLEVISKYADRAKNLNLVHHDLQHPLPDELLNRFDIVFLDPPWYVEYYKLFLSRAIEALHRGYIYVVLFPLLTRPNAIQERHEIFELVSAMGLVPVRIEEQILAYQTPLFEKISLSYQSIAVSDNWRKGDLLSLISSVKAEPIVTGFYKIETSDWKEVVIAKSKIKIRLNESNEYERPHIEPVYKDSPILKSVSRRDPKRQEIDLWTSKHQVFKLKGNNIVFLMLKGISENLDINTVINNISEIFKVDSGEIQDEVSQCYCKLREVVDYEIG